MIFLSSLVPLFCSSLLDSNTVKEGVLSSIAYVVPLSVSAFDNLPLRFLCVILL